MVMNSATKPGIIKYKNGSTEKGKKKHPVRKEFPLNEKKTPNRTRETPLSKETNLKRKKHNRYNRLEPKLAAFFVGILLDWISVTVDSRRAG